MTAIPARGGGGLKAWFAPACVLLVLLAALASIVLLSRQGSGIGAPPVAGDYVPPGAAQPVESWDVAQATPDKLVVGNRDGQRELSRAEITTVERLDAATWADLEVGQWLETYGVRNDVRSFGVRAIVAMPTGTKPDEDGFGRSAAGFTGIEATRDATERPFAGGTIESIEQTSVIVTKPGGVEVEMRGINVTVIGPSGKAVIQVLDGAPLRVLRASSPAEIQEGDRLAFRTGDPSRVLIVPDGAQE